MLFSSSPLHDTQHKVDHRQNALMANMKTFSSIKESVQHLEISVDLCKTQITSLKNSVTGKDDAVQSSALAVKHLKEALDHKSAEYEKEIADLREKLKHSRPIDTIDLTKPGNENVQHNKIIR